MVANCLFMVRGGFQNQPPFQTVALFLLLTFLLFLSLRLRIITSFVNWLHLSTNGLYSIYIFICSVFFLLLLMKPAGLLWLSLFPWFLFSNSFFSEDAVNIFGVRCTFWSLGDSLKPGGFVKSFVVSAFCFSLFQKPNGHPDSSKRHYFFPNIAVSSQTIF